MRHGDIIRNDIDRAELLKQLESFYGTSNVEQIGRFLKRDLKDEKRFKRLFEYIGFDVDEFFYCCAQHFFDIFNKATIRHIKRIMNES